MGLDYVGFASLSVYKLLNWDSRLTLQLPHPFFSTTLKYQPEKMGNMILLLWAILKALSGP